MTAITVDLNLALWMVGAFICGSIPFSVWLGQLFLRADIRRYGDGNPGATNVLRAGGRLSAFLALLLDYLKGALPVGVAHLSYGISGWQLALIAIMPVIGHAFSPFLMGRGGKSVAASFGIWSGLTLWQGPATAGIFMLAGVMMFGFNGWAVMLAMLGLLLYLLSGPEVAADLQPMSTSVLMAVWVTNLAIFVWKHRRELATLPRLRKSGTPID
jgi:glycerol-3-phosphate acyltransferase PlsY